MAIQQVSRFTEPCHLVAGVDGFARVHSREPCAQEPWRRRQDPRRLVRNGHALQLLQKLSVRWLELTGSLLRRRSSSRAGSRGASATISCRSSGQTSQRCVPELCGHTSYADGDLLWLAHTQLCLAPDDDGYGRYTLGDEDDTGDVVLAAPQDPTPRTSHRRSASPSSLPRQSAKRLRRGFFSRDKTRSASYSPSPLFHGLVSYGPAATPPLDTGTPFEQESSDCSEDEVYFPLPQIKRDDDDDEALLSPAAKFPQPAQRLIQLPVIERRASWSYTAPGGVRQFATYPYSTPHSPEVPIAAPAPAGYFHIPPSIAPALSQGLGPAYVCSPVQSPLVLPNARRAAPPLQPPPPVAAAAQRPLTHAALSPIQTTDAYAPKVPRLSELSSNWSTSPSLKTPVSAQRTKLH